MKKNMELSRRRLYVTMSTLVLGSLIVLASVPLRVAAQTDSYPARPIKIVVPFPPGGAADYLGRVIAQKLGERLRQSVVVENRPGASSNVGTSFVARAAADGYTLLLASSNMAINVALYPQPGFDTKDFAPIAVIATLPNILVVNPEVPARSMGDLIAYGKAHPGKLVHASSGSGTPGYLAFDQFRSRSKTEYLTVSYKGLGEVIPDLLSNRVNMMFGNIPGFLSYIKSGKLRPIAVTGSTRSATLPDVPTVTEAGLPGYDHPDAWYGLAAPATVQRAILERLNTAVNDIVSEPAFRAQLVQGGTDPAGGTIEQFRSVLAADVVKYADIVKRAKIIVE